MFAHSAGEDLLDQLRFARDQGFVAWEDNGMNGRSVDTQNKIAKTMDELGMQMGVETMQEIAAEEGQNWRDNLDQIAYERRYREKLGIPDPALPGLPPGQIGAPVEEKEDA